jgi:hypothetical protein
MMGFEKIAVDYGYRNIYLEDDLLIYDPRAVSQ